MMALPLNYHEKYAIKILPPSSNWVPLTLR